MEKNWIEATKEGEALLGKSKDERITYMKIKYPLVKYAASVANGRLVPNERVSNKYLIGELAFLLLSECHLPHFTSLHFTSFQLVRFQFLQFTQYTSVQYLSVHQVPRAVERCLSRFPNVHINLFSFSDQDVSFLFPTQKAMFLRWVSSVTLNEGKQLRIVCKPN